MISKIINEKESGITLEKYVRKVLNTAPLSFIYKLFRKKRYQGKWSLGKRKVCFKNK